MDHKELRDLAQGPLWPTTCSSFPYSAAATLVPLVFLEHTMHVPALGFFPVPGMHLP